MAMPAAAVARAREEAGAATGAASPSARPRQSNQSYVAAGAALQSRQNQTYVVTPGRTTLTTVRGTPSAMTVHARPSLVDATQAKSEVSLGPAVFATLSDTRQEVRALMARPRPQQNQSPNAESFQAASSVPSSSFLASPPQEFRDAVGFRESTGALSEASTAVMPSGAVQAQLDSLQASSSSIHGSVPQQLQIDPLQAALTQRSQHVPEAAMRRSSPGASPSSHSAGARSPQLGLSLSKRQLATEDPVRFQQQQQHHQSALLQAGVVRQAYAAEELRRHSLGERRPFATLGVRQLSEGSRDVAAYHAKAAASPTAESRAFEPVPLKTPRPHSPPISSRDSSVGAEPVRGMGAEQLSGGRYQASPLHHGRDPAMQRRSLGLPPWKRPAQRAETSTSASPHRTPPATTPVGSQRALSGVGSSAAAPPTAIVPAPLPMEGREAGWQAGLRQVRQELLAQRAVHAEAMAEEARARRRELESLQAQQARSSSEQVANLRFETALSMRQEREARLGEAAELRSTIEILKMKVAEVQQVLTAARPPPQWQLDEAAMQQGHAGWQGGGQGGGGQFGAMDNWSFQHLEGLARELEAERLGRCTKDADIHARIGREVADLGRRLEEQYQALGEEIADASRQMEERRLALEKALEHNNQLRAHDTNELRAMVETVWQRASVAHSTKEKEEEEDKKSYYFRFEESNGEEHFKELVGDQEDINTLYEMVREALGDTVSLRQEIGEERDDRRKDNTSARQQLERLERQLNTVQALVQQATPVSSTRDLTASTESLPAPGKTPSASVPTSPDLERRRLKRDSSVETIRNEFAIRMEDQRRRLMEHLETQLSASQDVHKAHRTEMLGHVEAHMADILKDVSTRVERSEASLRREVRSCVEEIREQLSNVKLRSDSHFRAADAAREHLSPQARHGTDREQSPELPVSLASFSSNKSEKTGGDLSASGGAGSFVVADGLKHSGLTRSSESAGGSSAGGHGKWNFLRPST